MLQSKPMAYFYHLDSGGYFTNLQLYALRQAKACWSDLQRDYARDGELAERLRERCVFAVAALGLSVSQLLGQNNPRPTDRVPSPTVLLRALVEAHGIDPAILERFERFVRLYDGCRHFGLSTSGVGHERVKELTFDATTECFEIGLDVWAAVLSVFGKQPGSDLGELDVRRYPDEDEEEFFIPDE